jgi:hypothetical protein
MTSHPAIPASLLACHKLLFAIMTESPRAVRAFSGLAVASDFNGGYGFQTHAG